MKKDLIAEKIYSLSSLGEKVKEWKNARNKIVFTNGVFDILHKGHLHSLIQAAGEGDILIVGLNADESVKKIKGSHRPLNNEQARAELLAAFYMVDAVVLFREETPLNLIKTILPDVLVKGGDYTIDQIAGAKEVITHGGKVLINPILDGYSTSGIIERIQS